MFIECYFKGVLSVVLTSVAETSSNLSFLFSVRHTRMVLIKSVSLQEYQVLRNYLNSMSN